MVRTSGGGCRSEYPEAMGWWSFFFMWISRRVWHMAKAKGDGLLHELAPLEVSVGREVVAVMTDMEEVQGVAWSPKYRRWRAYLHVGRVQVHHSLHGTKAEAIEARREAEREFGSAPSRERLREWLPRAAFRRVHRAPKVSVRRGALLRAGRVMREVARLVHQVSADWPEEGVRCRLLMSGAQERLFARRIGQLLALAEYLRITGDVRLEEVEAGMREEVGRIVSCKG
jgi:hypothetical protein